MYTNWQTTRDWIQSPLAEIEYTTNSWKRLSHLEIDRRLMLPQPHVGENMSCVAMVILGYYDMPWVTIPCDLLLPNSAVVCEVIKGNNMQHLSGTVFLQLIAFDYICPEFWVLVNVTCILIIQHPMPPRMPLDFRLASSNDILSNENLRLLINIYLMYHNPKPLKTKTTNGRCSEWQMESNSANYEPEKLVEKPDLDCAKVIGMPLIQQAAAPERNSCHLGHFRCSDGSCISNMYHCDGYVHCHDHSDEKDCEPICSSPGSTTPPENQELITALNTWCRTINCNMPTCQCDPKWYQCISGGCIHFSFVCNGQNNCIDGSDEYYCHEVDIAEHNGVILEDNNLFSQINCSEYTVPCTHAMNSCFPLEKLCLFERHTNGTPTYCSKAGHIRGCSPLQCPGKFKCSTAYCIPLYMVCNKVIDCPNGDDEIRCDFIRCTNLFRCNKEQTCINLNQIQDGRSQCSISGEDELAFHSVPCPSVCQCRGFVMSCQFQSLHLIPSFPLPVKAMLFRGNRLQSLTSIFTSTYHSKVLKLDLSDNIIETISEGNFPRTLLFLNISYNRITVLDRSSFEHCTKLLDLQLQGNFIQIVGEYALSHLANTMTLNLHGADVHSIAAFSFADMARLQVLNVSNNQLQVLNKLVLHGLHSLTVLDVRENKNLIILPTSFDFLLTLKILTTDKLAFCCFTRASLKCGQEERRDQYNCERLIPNIALRIILWLVCFLMIIFNMVSFVFWCHGSVFSKKREVNPFFFLPPCMNVADILYVIYLLIIASHDQVFKEAFPAYRNLWQQGFGCDAALVLSHLSVYASYSFGFIICIYRYMATVHPLKQTFLKNNKRIVLVFVLIILLSESLLLIVGSRHNDAPLARSSMHGFCFLMYPAMDWRITSHAVYLIVTTTVVICHALLSGSICIKIHKNPFHNDRKPRERCSKHAIVRLFVLVSSNCISWTAICTQQVSLLLGHPLPFHWQLSFIILFFPANSCIGLLAVTFQSSNFKALLSTILGSYR